MRHHEYLTVQYMRTHSTAKGTRESTICQVARQVARTADWLDLTYAEVTAAVTAAVADVI